MIIYVANAKRKMKLKIVSVQFDYRGVNKYSILSKVFEHSVKKNCPNAELEMLKVKPPELQRRSKSKSFASNTLKLELWLDVLKNTDDNVVFMDCDMIVLKDISEAFNYDFDIGYTVRTNSSKPFNGGVVFVKNTLNAIKFIELWKEINRRMYNDYTFHMPYRTKYAGMNQASFGYLLEKKNYEAKLKKFRCDIWNACDDNWRNISIDTKVMHIKGGLRRTVLSPRPINSRYDRAAIVWQNLAIEAGAMTGQRQHIENIHSMPAHPLIAKVRGLKRRRKIV